MTDGVNGTLVEDGDFKRAIDAVPDYDPQILGETGRRFDVIDERRAFASLWSDLIAHKNRAGR